MIVTNQGKAMHECVLGTTNTLAEHAALMKRFPNMEHDEPYMAHVPPMTMVFRVASPALLDGLKVGDKVQFEAEELKGNLQVKAIAVLK